jgi:hypothetical protein
VNGRGRQLPCILPILLKVLLLRDEPDWRHLP